MWIRVVVFPSLASAGFAFVIPPVALNLQPLISPRMDQMTTSTTQLGVSFAQDQLSEHLSREFVDETTGATTGVSSTQLNHQRSFISSEYEANPTFDFPLFRGICESQLLILAVSVCLFGIMGFGPEGVGPIPLTLSEFTWTPVVGAGIAATLFIALDEFVSRSSFRPASHLHIATAHFVHTLFGRRAPLHSRKEGALVQVLKNTATTTLASGFLSLLTATCQEVIFRGLLVEFLLQHAFHATIADVLIQSLLYAVVTTNPNKVLSEDELFAMAIKLAQGLLLGTIAISHGLMPCILVQWLVNWHIWTKTWHQVSGQMDWVECQEIPTQGRSSSVPKLSTPMYQSLYRLFCAFDSSHQHRLSLSDVQRAVSYAFVQADQAPSPQLVKALTMQYLKAAADEEDIESLSFDDFLSVLLALRSQSMESPPASEVVHACYFLFSRLPE